jgi:hypothetical protein
VARPARRPRRLTVDLHGYDVLSAVDLAVSRVEDAYRTGYEEGELLHGAGDVHEPVETGRGRIKWELRRLHDGGGLDRWIVRSGSWPKTTSLVLRLRPNPTARPEHWRAGPARRHDASGGVG